MLKDRTDTDHRPTAVANAVSLFTAGRFDEAETALQQLPEHPERDLRLAELALLRNRPERAVPLLARAMERGGQSSRSWNLLADAYYRKGELGSAAYCHQRLRRLELAGTLAAMAELEPYRLAGTIEKTDIPWITADPLPVISAEINGQPAHLVVDTGAGDLVLDERFAMRTGIRLGGRETRHFAGGLASAVWYGHAAELRLQQIRLQDLPVQILALDPVFSPFFTDLEIHGIVGISVLSRFAVTLDYQHHSLGLAPLAARDPADSDPTGTAFWIAENHFPIASATIERDRSCLLFVDTGMAGAAFALPASTARAVGMRPNENQREAGQGGGGSVSGHRVHLQHLCLDRLCRQRTDGILLEHFPLEHRFGFPVSGILAHEFFRGGILTLDFVRMRLSLTAGRENEPG